MNLLDKARNFATIAHKGQTYGDNPYTYHLAQVSYCARGFRLTPTCEIVAWLHDILEDTDTIYEQLQQEFGDTIADAVYALTDKAGVNRTERHLNTYYALRENPIALQVKLCDRLCNMRESVGKSIGKMYKNEYIAFKYCFYKPNNNIGLWSALDAAYEELINA